MSSNTKDNRSFEDRIVKFPKALIPTHADFDRDAADGSATQQEHDADELLMALRGSGMTAGLAMKVIKFYESMSKVVSFPEGATSTMDSVLRADSQQYLLEIMVRLLESKKPLFSLGCLMLGLEINHPALKSYRHWAKQRKLSVEHVSQEVEMWQALLKLPKTSAQKSESAKESYRLRNQPRKAA